MKRLQSLLPLLSRHSFALIPDIDATVRVNAMQTQNDRPVSVRKSVVDQVRLIRRQLALSGAPNGSDTLKYVLMDMEKASYTYPIDTEELESMGVTVINCPLLAQSGDTYMDARLLAEALLSLS